MSQLLMYNLPFEENTKSNCNEHLNTNKKFIRKQNKWAPRKEEEEIIGLLIIVVEIK